MITFLIFILFFGLTLSSIRCLRRYLNFYPILVGLSGDFGSVTSVVLTVTFRVVLFTFWYFNFDFFYWILVLFVGAMTILLSRGS